MKRIRKKVVGIGIVCLCVVLCVTTLLIYLLVPTLRIRAFRFFHPDAELERFVDTLFQIPHDGINTDISESNVFPAKPQSAIVNQNGRSVVLSQEQLDTVYDLFMEMTQDSIVVLMQRQTELSGAKNMLLDNICIEFRYEQRQKFTNPNPYAELINGIWHVPNYYDNAIYDALLFVIQTDGTIKLMRYLDNVYEYRSADTCPWSTSDIEFAAFTDFLYNSVI